MAARRVERVHFVLSWGVVVGGAEMEESDGTGFTLALSGVSGLLSEINKSLKLRPAD